MGARLLPPNKLTDLLYRRARGETTLNLAEDFGLTRYQAYNLISTHKQQFQTIQALLNGKAALLRKPKTHAPERAPGIWRKCLGPDCDTEFWTDSPFQRLCVRCKDTNAWRAGQPDYPVARRRVG